MSRKIVKSPKPAQLDPSDHRLVAAAAAGAQCAEDVWTNNGWRKAPAQCPVCCDLIKDERGDVILALLDAWTTAYRARCRVFESAALADIM